MPRREDPHRIAPQGRVEKENEGSGPSSTSSRPHDLGQVTPLLPVYFPEQWEWRWLLPELLSGLSHRLDAVCSLDISHQCLLWIMAFLPGSSFPKPTRDPLQPLSNLHSNLYPHISRFFCLVSSLNCAIYISSLSPPWPSALIHIQCLFIYFILFILAAGLSCGMQDLLVAACRLLSCRMQDLVPQSGIEPGPPCTGSVESYPLDHMGSPIHSLFK